MAWTVPYNLLGAIVSGDVGEITVYTDRLGRKIAFPKSPPTTPPSPGQVTQRERFRLARQDWHDQSDTTKFEYEEACRRASLIMTGQNLWISVALTSSFDALDKLAVQTGTSLPHPTVR